MPSQTQSVLLISESADEIRNFTQILLEKGYLLRAEDDFDPSLVNQDIGLVIVDLIREDGRGLDILAELGARSTGFHLPILVIAGLADKVALIQALEAGVTDFLWKGASSIEIQARIAAAFRTGDLQKNLAKASRVDALTGTCSKTHMMDILEREFERSRRYKRSISCLLVDIDAFEELEQTYSAEQSNGVLKLLSEVLLRTFRNVDDISRFRNSIFLVLLPETSPANAIIAMDRVRSAIESVEGRVAEVIGHAQPDGGSWSLSLTAGISTYPDDGLNSYADLIMAAETALYEAKRKGRGETASANFQ